MRIPVPVQAAIVLLALAHPPAASAQATIYRCSVDGVPTFSDRQCGPESQPLKTMTLNVAEAPAVAAADPQPKSARSQRRKDPIPRNPGQDKRAEACAKLALSLKELRSKLRAGYSAKEGERLRARQASLRERQKIARCG
jgi:hypothetical protein